MRKFLTCVTIRRIYMSYGAGQRCPKSRAAQSGSHPAARTQPPARGGRPPRPDLCHLQALGLSLSRAGAATETARSGRRCQSVLHREAFARSGGENPDIRRLDRVDAERDGQPSLAIGAASRGRPWLTARRISNGHCGWNINLIGCWRRNWLRHMSCSCPTRSGLQPEPLPGSPPASRRS